MKTQENKTPSLEELNQENRRKVAQFQTKYPKVFSRLEYLETLDGWDNLIDSMSSLIESYIDHYVPEELRDQIYFSQIKQKLGGLRVHMNHSAIPQIQGIISMAEAISYHLCEMCGNAADHRNVKGWLTALCDTHYQQEMERTEKP